MEPLSAVVRLSANQCDIWTGDWDISGVQDEAVRITSLRQEQVFIHSVYGGGSFGRRGGDASQAVEIAKAIGGHAPVKLLWTREEDIQTGPFRPMYLHRLTAGLDEQGNLIAWQHRIVGQSVLGGDPAWIVDGVDITSVAGASNIPYDIANILVDLHSPTPGIPPDQWRSVGDSHTAFSVETFLDDVAHAAGKDPYQLRLELLSKDPREQGDPARNCPRSNAAVAVCKVPARPAGDATGRSKGWMGKSPSTRQGARLGGSLFLSRLAGLCRRGDRCFGWQRQGRPCSLRGRLWRCHQSRCDPRPGRGRRGVWTRSDSVQRSHPKAGQVEQSNFNDYRVLRMNEMPKIEVYIVDSAEPPSGIGEPTVPPIWPAVSNAIFAATENACAHCR